MANRVNRAIELLDQGQPIYYSGAHTGHVLTREQGTKDAAIWSDYINVGMGARLFRYGRPGKLHARAGGRRADR